MAQFEKNAWLTFIDFWKDEWSLIAMYMPPMITPSINTKI